MRPESKLLGQALLDHRRRTVTQHPPGNKLNLSRHTVAYGELCNRAGVPHLTKSVGSFLQEIALWCQSAGYPPLNALAVSAATGIPGEGYDGAGDCEIVHWPAQAESAVRFTGYPGAMP